MKLSKQDLISPCGLNCAYCRAFLQERNPCSGCRDENNTYSLNCKIKDCNHLKEGLQYCNECKEFPCKKRDNLDKRYKTRYSIDLQDNLHKIKELGIEQFLKLEDEKWTCANCGEIICLHKGICEHCKESE